MLDQATHLFRLQAIAEHGSMRRAAKALGLTQPALTRSIQILERSFGRDLLERHAKGVTLTGFGREVMQSIDRLSRLWQLETDGFRDANRGNQGVLRLCAGPVWATRALPNIVAHLQAEFDGLTIEVETSGMSGPFDDLVAGKIDVFLGGLQGAQGLDRRLQQKVLSTVHDRVLAHEGHAIFAHIDPAEATMPQVVLDFPWVVYTADPAYERASVQALYSALGKAPNIKVRSQSLITVLGLLQHGPYLGILPEAAAQGVMGPRLRALPYEQPLSLIHSGAVYRAEMASWPPLTRLLELCARSAPLLTAAR